METLVFLRPAEKLFGEDEKQELMGFLAANPLVGPVIPGTGGVRRVRFAASGRGKRAGARAVYCFLDETMPLFALPVYTENTRTNMSSDEQKAVVKLAAELKLSGRRKGNEHVRR